MRAFRNCDASNQSITIAVVQGNIPQELKWEAAAREYIINRYFSLSILAARQSPDLIVWPEAAVPVVLSEGSDYKQNLQKFSDYLGRGILTGAVTYRNNGYYNSAVLFQPNSLPEQYDKVHLVPFGEYIPLHKIFGFLQTIVPIGEMQHGSEYRVFHIHQNNGGPEALFSCLICYEDMFPEISRHMVGKGAELLITVTNDAWYKRTSAPYQHFQASVFRAVENRVYMVRSANTGISGFVRPDGTVGGLVSDASGRVIFVAGFLTQGVVLSSCSKTLYSRYGDWFIVTAAIIILLALFKLSGEQRQRVKRHLIQ